ncbi:MAG TPA: hypothetical protein EYP90_01660 [Chromatiaceae bacterium]|nr:hypothetical protein [Chromatiaceae bacterium]HIP70381.1 hypothetical protein [Anaerolineae bacterium]
MKIKYTVVIILPVIFIFAIFYQINAFETSSTTQSLIPTSISDPAATVTGRIERIDGKTSATSGHVAWAETVSTTPNDSDVFYRKLPSGTTKNLSDSLVSEGLAGPTFVQPGTGDNVCILWRERLASGEFHLFLWHSETDTVVTSPLAVSGDYSPTFYQFNCDQTNNLKIVWKERTGIMAEELYLWDTANNTQTKISSDNQSEIRDVYQATTNTGMSFTWNEDGSIFLWSTGSLATQEVVSNGYMTSMFSDKNDLIHIFWSYSPEMGPTCRYHWDSNSQTSSLIMPCDDDHDLATEKDYQDNVHAVWNRHLGNVLNYWNVTENITETITLPNNHSVDKLTLTGGTGGIAHMIWEESNSDDIYYWNSRDKNVVLIQDGAFNSYITNSLTWDFDSTGDMHLIWGENDTGNVYYWNSASLTKQLLASSGGALRILVDNEGTAHVVYVETTNSTRTINYWSNQSNESQVVSSQIWTNGPFQLLTNANNDPFVFYLALIPSSSAGMYYYWSLTDGEVPLGKETFGASYFTGNMMRDDSGRIYIYWRDPFMPGDENTAYDEDMFAAWETQHQNSVYLPVIVSQ